MIPFAFTALLYGAFIVVGKASQMLFSAFSAGQLKIALWVVPPVLFIQIDRRVGVRQALGLLGFHGGAWRGYAFGLIATLPMFAVLALARTASLNPEAIAGTVLLGPFAEELLFRGFLFRQLCLRSGWTVRTAALASALAFGLAHLVNGPIRDFNTLLVAAGEVGMTAAGGALFAWIVYRWDNLWPAIGLHTCMNLWWEIYDAEDWARRAPFGTLGPSLAIAARFAAIGLAVYFTLRRPRAAQAPAQPSP